MSSSRNIFCQSCQIITAHYATITGAVEDKGEVTKTVVWKCRNCTTINDTTTETRPRRYIS